MPGLGNTRCAEYGGLVLAEKLGVIYGAMVMHLAPRAIDLREDARGANGQGQIEALDAEVTALAANRIEHFGRLMDGVVPELDVDLCRTREEALVDRTDRVPAALDATEWVVHGNVLGRGPVRCHKRHIPAVEGTVELNESQIG